MFTKWDQVESWIKDNNFAHWVITRSKPEDEGKKNDIIVDSNFYTGDDVDKIAMTKKYLELNGGRGYGVGFRTPNSTVGGTICEIRLDDTEGAPVSGMQPNITPLNIGEIEDRVRKQVMAEIREQDYAKRLGELERREKEFDAEKQSALGAFVHMISPVAKMMIERNIMPRVAGLDNEKPVEVAPIRAKKDKHEAQAETVEQAETEQPADEPDVFTDEEADALYSLCAKWKAADPNYLTYLQKIVGMAESHDQKYEMAKSFL